MENSMSVSIASPTTTAPVAAVAASASAGKPGNAKPPVPSTGHAPTASAQQQAALRQLLTKYTYDQTHGTDAATLSALRRQITAAAKALGQHVTLPQGPVTAEAGNADTPMVGPSTRPGKLNLLT
jgi:hypothetical protein